MGRGRSKQKNDLPTRRRGRYKGDLREEEILGALDRLLAEKPLKEVEVEELARAAGISRPTFYFYFESKNAVLASLTTLLMDRMHAAANEVEGELDPLEDIKARIATSSELWREKGYILRAAVQTWASEPSIRAVYEEGISYFVESLAKKIRSVRRSGAAPDGPPTAEALARALVWLNERCFYTNSLGSEMAVPDDELVSTLSMVWHRAIYCGDGEDWRKG